MWSDPSTLGGTASTDLTKKIGRTVIDASASDPYILIKFDDGTFLLTGVNPRSNSLSSKLLDVKGALFNGGGGGSGSGGGGGSGVGVAEEEEEITCFTLFRDEDYHGKRNYLRRATRVSGAGGGSTSSSSMVEIAAASSSSSLTKNTAVSSSVEKKNMKREEDGEDDADDAFLYGDDEEEEEEEEGEGGGGGGGGGGDGDVVMGEGEGEVEGDEDDGEGDEDEDEEKEEGLGDDGKVRFYMVCCTPTSLYVLSIPKLNIVFKYNPTEQVETNMQHSSSSARIPITSGPPLLFSSVVDPEKVTSGGAASAAAAGAGSGGGGGGGELAMERVTDVSMHFVGPLAGNSPCLVLCLETNENDVLVYETHHAPEEILFRRNAINHGLNIDLANMKLDEIRKRDVSSSVNSVSSSVTSVATDPGDSASASTTFSTGRVLPSSPSTTDGGGDASSSISVDPSPNEEGRHLMAFVRVSHEIITRPKRNRTQAGGAGAAGGAGGGGGGAGGAGGGAQSSLRGRRSFDRMSHVNGQSSIFYRGCESVWITSERGRPVVRRATATNIVQDLQCEGGRLAGSCSFHSTVCHRGECVVFAF